MGAAIPDERRAIILVDAMYMGENEAAKKHGVSARSIRNWKTELENSPTFSSIFQNKLKERDEAWAEEIPAAMKNGIEFLKEAFLSGRKTDPDTIEAVTKAIQTLSDIAITKDIINARLTG